jgi:hypothetical protein
VFNLCISLSSTLIGPWVLIPACNWVSRTATGLAGRVRIKVSESKLACPLAGLKEVSLDIKGTIKRRGRNLAL